MGRVKRAGRIRQTACLLCACILGMLLPLCVSADTGDHRIEQLYVNKPDVTVYYRDSEPDGALEAYLGGEQLTLEGDASQKVKDSEMGVDYYLLTDISGSIHNFEAIRDAILEFRKEMRNNDRMILISFGEKVTTVLDGSENVETANAAISALVAADKTTVLAEAVKETAKMMESASDPENRIAAMVIISDGKPDTDNKASIDNAENTLVNKGIQAYTIAADNDEGDSKTEIDAYRSRFSDIADATGGLSYVVETEKTHESVLNSLKAVRTDLLTANIANFSASSNQVSRKTEEFILEFLTPGVRDTRNVLVEHHKKDSEPPTLEKVGPDGEPDGSRSIVVTYTEDVRGADRAENYSVKADGKEVPVSQVRKDSERKYTLLLAEPFHNADYEVTVNEKEVTDISQEENALSNGSGSFTVDTISPEVTKVSMNSDATGFAVAFSESVKGADNADNYTVTLGDRTMAIREVIKGDEEHGQELILEKPLVNDTYTIQFHDITDAKTGKNGLREDTKPIEITKVKEYTALEKALQLLAAWWPLVLTAVLLILIIILLHFRKKIRSNRYAIIDGEMVNRENVESKLHVGVAEAEEIRESGIPITVLLSNGQGEPRHVERMLNGSLIVGRNPQMCDIYCDDARMSKQHFAVSVDETGNLYIDDLQSTNGTIVNGVRISGRRILLPGDEVRAGSIRFRFEINRPRTPGSFGNRM